MLEPEYPAVNIEEHRREFPGLAQKVYLNYGGQGMLPQAALEAIVDTYNYLEINGPFSIKSNSWLTKRASLLRQDLARELQVEPKTLTLTESVTAGCNIVLWGIPWQSGDRILLGDCEHPSVVAIVEELARRFDLAIDYARLKSTLNQGNAIEAIKESLKPRTKLVVVSHILWNTGQLLPIAEIVELCHRYPNGSIKVLIDAAQSFGLLPLNLSELGVDYYAFTGHKWLCGPAGVGGLYISPDAFLSLKPTFLGWRAIQDDGENQEISLKIDGQRFEVGTSAYPQYEGLRATLATHRQWKNTQDRYRDICQLSQQLWQNLSNIPNIECLQQQQPQTGLVCFRVKSKLTHSQIVANLEERGCFLRTLKDSDCIRACVHYFTLPSELETLVTYLQELIEPE